MSPHGFRGGIEHARTRRSLQRLHPLFQLPPLPLRVRQPLRHRRRLCPHRSRHLLLQRFRLLRRQTRDPRPHRGCGGAESLRCLDRSCSPDRCASPLPLPFPLPLPLPLPLVLVLVLVVLLLLLLFPNPSLYKKAQPAQ